MGGLPGFTIAKLLICIISIGNYFEIFNQSFGF